MRTHSADEMTENGTDGSDSVVRRRRSVVGSHGADAGGRSTSSVVTDHQDRGQHQDVLHAEVAA